MDNKFEVLGSTLREEGPTLNNTADNIHVPVI